MSGSRGSLSTYFFAKLLRSKRYNSTGFDVQVTVHLDKFLLKNQLDALISQDYFWNKNLHVSDSTFVNYQDFFTVQAAVVYVIHVC